MDNSCWIKYHNLQLNLVQTELLVVSANHPARFPSRNLGVVIDDQLNFIDHIARTARSSKFSLSNIKKISPFLSKHAPQLLVQALVLSRWTTAMLSLQAIRHANDPECCSKSGL